jgi:hypothetical protein
VYLGLRQRILGLRPKDIKDPDAASCGILAVLMETGLESGVGTLVAIADGTASLYTSSGGGVLGAGENPTVAAIAKGLLSKAQPFLSKSVVTTKFPLPADGEIRFYIVARDRVVTAVGQESEMEKGQHPFSSLFHAGHELMTVIRLESEGRCPTGA